MSNYRITFFPVDNGDSTLIEADDYCVLTDLNIRQKSEDDDDDDFYDLADDLRQTFVERVGFRLNLFVLTHPDQDHCRGFDSFFYCGDPNDYDGKDDLVLIEELWVSPYMQGSNYATDESKPVFDEVTRRMNLAGDASANENGNRIKVLSVDGDELAGDLNSYLSWELLSPTDDECDINDDESSNPTSLTIRWTIERTAKLTKLLLAGDATVENWERIRDSYDDEQLKYNILLAPHHCSRHSLGVGEEDDFEFSDDAVSALSQVEAGGFIVLSAKEFEKDNTPPNPDARDKYLEILSQDKKRMLHTAEHKDKDGNVSPIIFELDASGTLIKDVPFKASAASIIVGDSGRSPKNYG